MVLERESVDGDEIGVKQGKQEETAMWNLSDQEKVAAMVGGGRDERGNPNQQLISAIFSRVLQAAILHCHLTL